MSIWHHKMHTREIKDSGHSAWHAEAIAIVICSRISTATLNVELLSVKTTTQSIM